jgi:probable HAF family extracellular repeat protein
MGHIRSIFGLAGSSAMLLLSTPAWAGLQVTGPVDLGCLPGGDQCSARAINEAGKVVGSSEIDVGGVIETHATLWDNGAVDLGTGGHDESKATGLNNSGQIRGRLITAGQNQYGAIWDNGVLYDVGFASVNDINESGVAIGSGPCTAGGFVRPITWASPSAVCTELPSLEGGYGYGLGINNANPPVMVYQSQVGSTLHGVVYEDGIAEDVEVLFPEVTTETFSGAAFVADNGAIAGMTVIDGKQQPWTWDQTNGVTLPGQPDPACGSVGIIGHNDLSQLAVLCGGNPRAVYLWDPTEGYTLVGDTHLLNRPALNIHGAVTANDTQHPDGHRAYVFLDGETAYLPTPGTGAVYAFDINDQNQIVGSYVDAEGNTQAAMWQAEVVDPTPEESLDALIEDLLQLVDDGTLNSGQGNSLVAKIEASKKKLDKGKLCASSGPLNAFVHEVLAMVSAGKLTQAEADALISQVDAIGVELDC